jgi:hypothetical protein
MLALAYCHVPVVVAAGLIGHVWNWKWLTLVAVLPWMGMILPILLLVAAPFLMLAEPWTTMAPLDLAASWQTVLTITVAAVVFILVYSTALRQGSSREPGSLKWRLVLVAWTVVANVLLLEVTPRFMSKSPTHLTMPSIAVGDVQGDRP